MKSKILITGGAGFIGGFLADAFQRRGDSVRIVDSLARGRRDSFLEALLAHREVEFSERDLLRDDALSDVGEGYTHIFHLAAILGVSKVLEHPLEVLRDNVRATETVLRFAQRQSQLERLVFASTSEVYAGSLEHLDMPVPTPESTALALPDLGHPRTSYMLSKIYGEALVRHSGVPFTILRPHNVYGPRMGSLHVIPQLLERAHYGRDGEGFEVFSVDHSRTFCFIDDAVELFVGSSLSADCSSQTLNLGAQNPEIRIGELARIVLEVVGREMTVEAKPATAGSPVRRAPEMSRMTELTGLSARTPLQQGVERTYAWYAKNVFRGEDRDAAR
ncbi:MAG: NAD-dependent epimerase/dehydratase family protein [Myxococcota bacterium]